MARAARQARTAWSGVAIGAPKTAITASPMYLSRVPPSRSTQSVIRVRYSRSVRTPWGSFRSVKVVKSRMSVKRTVTDRTSPPKRSASGERTMRSTTSGLTYCWNARRVHRRCRSSVRNR